MNSKNISAFFIAVVLAAALTGGCGKKEESSSGGSAETSESTQSANEFNNKGMEFYKKKDYASAAEAFRQAIAASPKHKLANYNLACTYALMLAEDECVLIKESAIFNQLKIAADLDPNVKTKAPKDSDFKKFNKSTRTFVKSLVVQCDDSNSNDERCFDFDKYWTKHPGTYEIKNMKIILTFPSGSTELLSLPFPEGDSDPC